MKKLPVTEAGNWDFTFSQGFLLRFGSFVNILFIINIQTGSTGWTSITLFFFFYCHNCPVCRESRWKLKLGTHKDGPWRPCTLTPHPWLERCLGKRTSSLPCACWGGYNTHNPSSHLPLPSCSGWCPNASTSHLGLPKPVLTVGVRVGGGQHGEHSPLTVTPWSKDWLVDWLRFR